MDRKEWYLEYEIKIDRPGLLGDVSSLLGMLAINIVSINGIDKGKRGLLIRAGSEEQILRLESILETVGTIRLTKIREPKLRDRLAVRHGRYIQRDLDDKKTFQFVRDELGFLVDFLAEIFKEEGHKLIGFRGMPRVGKTESIVAGSVCANKKWLFVSSTLLKQTIRKQLIKDEYDANNIFIIDGIVSRRRADERHLQLVREIMNLPAVKVIEHPDIFVEHSEYSMDDFDYIIELRKDPDEEITYELLDHDSHDLGIGGFSGLDF